MPIYIYHSINYGKTFEVFHPFSKGDEPVLANFSTIDKEVHITTPVEFSNFSIGDIQEYQWDFDNNGSIDSYEEEPSYIFQDTGYYSVKLSIVGEDSTNSFIRENYIHIIDTTTNINENYFNSLFIRPNPFKDNFTVNFSNAQANYNISIYNLQGKKVKYKIVRQDETNNINFSDMPSGIYLLNINDQKHTTTYKIIKN